jgi:predicted RNA-binding Zn-ribbon protein involved in translation (DUF1610 family)
MISDTSKKWLEAGIVLAKDPNAKVVCPECAEGTLEVQDVRGELDPDVVERIMKCPVCGKFNALRLKRPQQDDKEKKF